MVKARRDFFDIPKKIHVDEEQSEWADSRCDDLKLSFAAYIRMLVDEDKKRIELEVLQKEQSSNRSNLTPFMGKSSGLSQEKIEAIAVAVSVALSQMSK